MKLYIEYYSNLKSNKAYKLIFLGFEIIVASFIFSVFMTAPSAPMLSEAGQIIICLINLLLGTLIKHIIILAVWLIGKLFKKGKE